MSKELITNIDNLKDEEVNEVNKKSRLIVINSEGKILVAKYAGVYLLPGGKNEQEEDSTSGLIRELKEEAGIEISGEKIEFLLKAKMYAKNYQKVGTSDLVNRLSITNYYYLFSDKKVVEENIKLDVNEQKYGFDLEYIDLEELIKLVTNSDSVNPRKKYFDEELLKVLEEFKKYLPITINNTEKLIDMHIHTCYSDGNYYPFEIVNMVKKSNVGVFSITDHDTVLGCKQLENFNDHNLLYIPGIEMSAAVPKGRMHILGYNIDIHNKELNDVLDRKRLNSVISLKLMYEYINKKYNIVVPAEEFDKLYSKVGDVGRPDLALIILKYGYCESIQEVFERYLNEAFDATRINRITTSKEDCMHALKAAGGYISLAHPISLNMEYKELKNELIYLKSLGLDAIEICHSNQSEEYRNMLRKLKIELGLYETAGSDYHGPTIKPDIELGTGQKGNIKVKKLEILNIIGR